MVEFLKEKIIEEKGLVRLCEQREWSFAFLFSTRQF